MKGIWIAIFLLIGAGSIFIFSRLYSTHFNNTSAVTEEPTKSVAEIVQEIIQPQPDIPEVHLPEPPSQKLLNNSYHIFQTFNNCGPASLSMALSYYKISASQHELGRALRPYQNAVGDNDDKSTTLSEMAEKSKDYNLIPYHRPNGSIDIVKQFIANDMPVVTRTWLKPNEDIGHYRVIKGYDDTQEVFIQDDSLQGKDFTYTYDDFFELWKPFSFEYLVLVPSEKVEIAEAILGSNVDEKYAWKQALETAQADLELNSNDVDARFNLSIALYHLGRYKESVEEFEKVENRLPSRALWYQIEPIKSYYELEDYDRVFEITNGILNNHNRAFSELYIIRGNIYKEQGDISRARSEYEKAVMYNVNLKEAQEALDSL